jgi:hypothetical protein
MKTNNLCESIRQRIENAIILGNGELTLDIQAHIRDCRTCRVYADETTRLAGLKYMRFSVPDAYAVKFSPMVRAEIERRKQVQRPISALPRFVLQGAVVILVVAAVIQFLNRTYDPVQYVDDSLIADLSYEEFYTLYGTGNLYRHMDILNIPDESYYWILFGNESIYTSDWPIIDSYYFGNLDYLTDEQLEQVASGLEQML